MDKNFDGVLTKDEVVEGLEKLGYDDPEEEADHIFQIADINKNGTLEFSEWCTATMDKDLMLTKPKLEATFKMFDKNNGGSISFDELRSVLQGDNPDEFTDEVFKELINQIDINGNGEIDFKEFEKMMNYLVK